jgi:DNA helicase-2/ATP-dependent DNA helicase PcrA
MKIRDIMRKSSGLVSGYINGIRLKSAFAYYTELFRDKQTFETCAETLLTRVDAEAVWNHTAGILAGKNGRIEAEDLAPIMLLYMAFYGREGFDIRHVVIDEAQDMSPFRAYTLKKLLNTGSFTILGDLCQGVYSHMGVKSWDEIADGVFGGKDVRYMSLEQSYRTTVEIMDFANRAARRLNLPGIPLAKPVIRHGNEVGVFIKATPEEAAAEINEAIAGFAADGYRSLAVICKTAAECTHLRNKLKAKARVLTGKESDYGGGVVILPAHLAKGLEFDCVIIANANRASYGASELDIKLLYVAMTRALHEMAVFSVGELCEIIQN